MIFLERFKMGGSDVVRPEEISERLVKRTEIYNLIGEYADRAMAKHGNGRLLIPVAPFKVVWHSYASKDVDTNYVLAPICFSPTDFRHYAVYSDGEIAPFEIDRKGVGGRVGVNYLPVGGQEGMFLVNGIETSGDVKDGFVGSRARLAGGASLGTAMIVDKNYFSSGALEGVAGGLRIGNEFYKEVNGLKIIDYFQNGSIR